MRPRDVTPRESSSARISFWRATAFFASEINCTSLASRTFFNSILAATFLTGAFLARAFFAATFFAGAFFAATFFAGAFFATAFLAGDFFAATFLAEAFFALFLSAVNTATIVLCFCREL